MTDVGRVFRPGVTRDVLACAFVVALASAIGEAGIFLRPDLSRTAGFLFGDPGYTLLVAREVLRGARLYTDIAYQYGFAPVYLYSGFAALAGNTPLAYLQFLLVCSLVNLILFYALARRAAGAGVAFIVTLFGALPVLIVPGAPLGGYVNSYYIPIERGLMLAAAVTWQPAARRTLARAIALGACLGMLQMVRFGPGIALGAVIVALDAALHLRERGTLRAWLAAEAPMVAAAAALEVARVAFAFALLPRPVALDVAWPSYILDAYGSAARYPGWHGWAMGFGHYLDPLTSLALLCAALAGLVLSRPHQLSDGEAAQTILPLFFVAGIVGLFRTEHHFYQAAWTVTSGAIIALVRWRRAIPVAIALWLPPLALVATLPLRPVPSSATTVAIADGWRLTMPREAAARSLAVARTLKQSGTTRVLFYPYLAGFNVALDLPVAGREATFMYRAIRPYEEESLARAYARVDTLVTCRTPQAWTTTPGLFDRDFPETLRAAVEPRATSVLWQDAQCRIVGLRLAP